MIKPKAEIIYDDLKMIALKNDITFDSSYLRIGRGVDCGELCLAYEKGEYVLFSYDRGLKTFYYATKSYNEFKHTFFLGLCGHNGFEYELACRIKYDYSQSSKSILYNDTRTLAFEYTLYLLNKINPKWMIECIPKYECLLNEAYLNLKVCFNKNIMKFELNAND